MARASGSFDVKMTPLAPDENARGSSIGRMVLDKEYNGDLAASGKGQMLAHRTGVDTSAGYVALELVTGTLAGKKGSFVLQHSGTMTRGAQSLSVTVVPDSGTEQLSGLSGTLKILIENGKHAYEFDYVIEKIS